MDIVSADDEDDPDPLVVREEVRRAILRHLNGDDEAYEKIRSLFAVCTTKAHAPPAQKICRYLEAVLANVSGLDKSCNTLVNALVYTEWVGRDATFISLYVKLLGNLAAAQTGYLGKMLFALVELLGKQKTRRLPGYRTVRQPLIHERALKAIQHLVHLLPPASSALVRIVQRKLSFDFDRPEERIIYTKNFMELMHYVPALKSDILAMVTGQLVQLDTAVQVDLEQESDEVTEEILENLVASSQTLVAFSSQPSIEVPFETEEEEEEHRSTTEESDLDEEEDLDPKERHRRKLTANVQQVDLVMDLLFRYYDGLVTSKSLDVRDNAIEQLISQFHGIVLPTYRSRHVQFLVFHFCQTTPVVIDRFVSSCITTIADNRSTPVHRQSAAAYLAGFVGRGLHVPADVVKDCFGLLSDDLNCLRKEYEPRCRAPDVKRYRNFYAIMQAMLYIFCFRWRDLALSSSDLDDDESGDEDEPQEFHFPDTIRETFTGAIYSPLNPLRVLTPAVVAEFARITHHLRFMYLFTKIEANKHLRLNLSRGNIGALDLDRPARDLSWVDDDGMLEGYFPYDPYQLPLSKKWVVGDYVEWEQLPGGEHEEEQDSEGREEEDDMVLLDEDVEGHGELEYDSM